jgi:hypothetical protein
MKLARFVMLQPSLRTGERSAQGGCRRDSSSLSWPDRHDGEWRRRFGDKRGRERTSRWILRPSPCHDGDKPAPFVDKEMIERSSDGVCAPFSLHEGDKAPSFVE